MDSSQNPFEIGDGKEFQLSAVEFDDVTVDSVVLVIRPLNSGYSARLPVISADAAHYNDTISNLENGHCQPFLVGAGRPTSAFVRKPGGPAMFGHSQRELTASFRTNGSLRDRFVFHKGTAGRGTFAHDVEIQRGIWRILALWYCFSCMSRFTRAGVWFLVAVVVLLPLYELSDYTEVWPDDGNVILPLLGALLAGMALVSGAFFKEAISSLVRLYVNVEQLLKPLQVCAFISSVLITSAPREVDRTLAFSDLRI